MESCVKLRYIKSNKLKGGTMTQNNQNKLQ